MTRWLLGIMLLIAACALLAQAHEVRPAYLELRQTAADTFDVLWKVPALGDTMRLGLYVRLPETCENLTEPRGRFAADAYIERWRIRHAQALVGSTISIDGLQTTLTDVLVRIERLDGTTQVARLLPSNPSLVVEAAPNGWQVVWTYVVLGVEHILLGIDHLLFVLGLLLLVDRRWTLLKTITAFTVAHSMTLALATFAIIQVSVAPLNATIALSILLLGPEIVRKWRGETSFSIRHPWVVAYAFGLLHGIGFASGLSLTGVPRGEIPSALLCFNLGVEAGQLAFVLLALVTAQAMRTLDLDRPRWVTRIPGYTVGALGAYWTIQRIFLLLAR